MEDVIKALALVNEEDAARRKKRERNESFRSNPESLRRSKLIPIAVSGIGSSTPYIVNLSSLADRVMASPPKRAR